MSDIDYLWNRRSDIRQRVLVNRMYYQERQRIFEGRDGYVKVIALLAGSVAFGRISSPAVVEWCAALITASSAASLVFGFGTKARDSAKRSADWALLERDIEAVGERAYTEADLSKWAARCNEIEAGEPAANHAIWERCNVRACESMGSKTRDLTWWERYRPALLIH